MTSIILSTAYFPPVQYISKFLLYDGIYIESHENYQKQSYRNRCYIYGANGPQCMVIPVKKQHGSKMPVAEVEIDYKINWRRIHLKSIESAYRLSAFYEYYVDDIQNMFEQEIPLLIHWNSNLLLTLLQLLGLKKDFAFTSTWEDNPGQIPDYRQAIHPKKRLALPDPDFNPLPYQQVFRERYGFIPNLSILDLLFNEGPEAVSVLRKGVKV